MVTKFDQTLSSEDRQLAYGSVAELAKATGLSKSALYEEMRSGRLVGRKYGRRTIFLKQDVEAFIRGLPTTVERAFRQAKERAS